MVRSRQARERRRLKRAFRPRRSVRPSPKAVREGSILVVVAAGLLAIFGFAALSVDLGFLHLARSQVQNMTLAGARAGYERLKVRQFNYAAYQTEIDGVIHDYMRSNGATDAVIANTTIEIDRRGYIRVTAAKPSPFFFGAAMGHSFTAVAGEGILDNNNLAPFGVPTSYHDPDRDGLSNWNATDETVATSTSIPWAWTVDKPYIIKFGRDSGQPGDNADYVLIPMDDDPHEQPLLSGASGTLYSIPAQTTAPSDSTSKTSSSGLSHTNRNMSTNKASRASLAPTQIGLIRAYGIAYDVSGALEPEPTDEFRRLFWIFGYAGGSFLISMDALAAAGYGVGTETDNTNLSKRAHITKGGVSTNVRCIPMKTKNVTGQRQGDLDFLNKLIALNTQGYINFLRIQAQPKIATFTENNDPVTMSMMNAGIPFTAFGLSGATNGFHSFSIDPQSAGETAATIMAKLNDPANGGPFNWLHLHHENFVQPQSGSNKSDWYNDKADLVDFIRNWVVTEQRFMFAACWATELLEVALAKRGSSNWTASGATPTLHTTAGHISGGQVIEYGQTFAFHDFHVRRDELPNRNNTYYQGNIARGWGLGCATNEACYEESEIDSEQPDNSNAYLQDYLNPLLQNHGGFAGLDYNEDTDQVTTVMTASDYIRERTGATDSYRHLGDGALHCASGETISQFGIPNPPTPTLSDARECFPDVSVDCTFRPSFDSDGGPIEMYLDETKIGPSGAGCDVNGDGVLGLLPMTWLRENGGNSGSSSSGWRCPCGSSNTSGDNYRHFREDSSRWYFQQLDCDGTRGDGQWYTNALVSYDGASNACSVAHSHEIVKTHVMASGGVLDPRDLNPAAKVMILSQQTGINPGTHDNTGHIRYLTGIEDDDTTCTNGCGRWSYLSGHSAGRVNGHTEKTASGLHSSSAHEKAGIAGMRLYLNNILFGATQGPQPGGGFFTPGTGAINPAALGLGTGAGEFGSSTFTNNAFGSIFKIGTKGVGLPIGAQFKTAPGNFAAQTDSAMNFMMVDSVTSTTRSSTWVEFQALPVGDRSGHPQVVTVATIERIPESPGAITPTPEANLDDYFPTGSPASNPERNKSIYAGNAAYGEDDPQQARSVHVVAFKSFFLIDPANQDPVTTSAAIDAHFVAAKWRDGEVRGYFLGEVIPPEAGVVYPASPTADPR